MASGVEKARNAALENQRLRTEEAIAQRVQTPNARKLKENSTKLAAASAKRKKMASQAASFQSPLKKPKSNVYSTPSPQIASTKRFKCVICNQRDERVRFKCVFCNASVHSVCTIPVANTIGVELFPESEMFCSSQCYNANQDDDMSVTPNKHESYEVRLEPMYSPKETPSMMDTPTSNSTTFVEGEEIKEVILEHSGVKVRRQEGKFTPQQERLSRNYVYDDTDDEFKSPERKVLFPPTPTPLPTPKPLPTPTIREDVRLRYMNRYNERHVDDSTANIENDPRYYNYFNPPTFIPRKRHALHTSLPKWLAMLIIVLLLLTASFIFTSFYIESLPYCDSNGNTPTSICHACPEHGICFNGELKSCRDPYVNVEHACVEPQSVKRDAELMAALLIRFLTKQVTQTMCNTSIWSPTAASDHHVVVTHLHMRTYIRSQAMWHDIPPAAFDASFTKAFQILKEFEPNYYFTQEDNVVLSRDDVSFVCSIQLHLIEYMMEYVFVIGVLLATWAMTSWLQHRQAAAAELKQSIHALHSVLKHPSNDLIDCAVTHLRHILGITKDSLWKEIQSIVQKDVRIRERYIIHRGQQVLIWEWIGSRQEDGYVMSGKPIDLVDELID